MGREWNLSFPMGLSFVRLSVLNLTLSDLTHAVSGLIPPSVAMYTKHGQGVGQTTPCLTMFKDAAEAAQLLSTFTVNVNESVSSIGRNFALTEILNDLARDRVNTIAESVGTTTVARDMLSIVEAFGQNSLQYWGFS